MGTKKSNNNSNVMEEKINIPEDVKKCTFFKRLPYKISPEQWNFIEAIWDKNNICVMCNAKAGSSKTTVSVGMALLMAMEFKLYSKIYYIISPCEEDKIGFIPGDINQKIDVYRGGLKAALVNWGYDPNKYVFNGDMTPLKNGECIIEAIPHTFMRGMDISNSFVILDEAQNYKTADLKKVLSRCHDDCKVIVVGHSAQCDLRDPRDSGFGKALQWAKNQDFIKIVELTENHRGKFSNWADSL